MYINIHMYLGTTLGVTVGVAKQNGWGQTNIHTCVNNSVMNQDS